MCFFYVFFQWVRNCPFHNLRQHLLLFWVVQHCYQSRYYGAQMLFHLVGELSALWSLGCFFLLSWISVSHTGKSQSRGSGSTQVIRSQKSQVSTGISTGISRASPTSCLCFYQGLREQETSVCSAPTPLLSQKPNHCSNSVAEVASQGWSSCAGLPGDITGDITRALHIYKGSLCRSAHFRENWYPCVFNLL